MKQFLIHRWFLLALVGVIFVGVGFSSSLSHFFEALPGGWENLLIWGMMFLMALSLDARAIGSALGRPAATLLAVAANYGVAPMLAWLLALALARVSQELALGLLIAAAVPTTITSAAVWTRRAGGNDAVALMVTLVTNLACFAVTPLLLWIMAGATVSDERFRPGPMMIRLALIVLAPLLLAQALRRLRVVADWAGRRKMPLGVVCQLGMLVMILTGVVQCGEKLRDIGAGGADWTAWAATIGSVMAVHLGTLVLAQSVARSLGLSRADWIAVGFAGSQKTLLVGLGIAISYADFFGPLAALPMVVYHVGQLLVDTLIADRLRVTGIQSRKEARLLGEAGLLNAAASGSPGPHGQDGRATPDACPTHLTDPPVGG
jgi:sodium/bile acid cotransporter 7